MNETEGVIKYQLDYSNTPPVSADIITELNSWRRILFLLGLIGQDQQRYGGLGYGNVSCRLGRADSNNSTNSADNADGEFLITGTQTSHLAELGPEHYTTVTSCDPKSNRIVANGPVKPSSEALAHGALYFADRTINFVFHTHCPEIWSKAGELGIAMTDPNVQYGTPEMAREFAKILESQNPDDKQIIVMSGHQDGVVSYGATAEETGEILVNCFSRALQLKARK